MKGDRRSVVAGIGTTLLTAITGYLGSGKGDDVTDDTARAATSVPEIGPTPTIVERTVPEPTVVRVDDEPTADGDHEFAAEIYNAGAGGDIGVTLVWLHDLETDPNDSSSLRESSRNRFFEASERAQVAVTSRVPDGFGAYELRTWVSTIGVEIENDGGSGRIDVVVRDEDRIIDETEVTVGAGETVSLEFEGDYSRVDPANLSLEAYARTHPKSTSATPS